MPMESMRIVRMLKKVFWLGVAPFVAAFLCVFLVTYPFIAHFSQLGYRLIFVIAVPIVYLALMRGMKKELAGRQESWFKW